MPPAIIAAGIAAVATVGGAVISSSASKKAAAGQTEAATDIAAAQADATDKQIANSNANRDYQYNLNAPTIGQGQQASDLYGNFIGLNGGTAAADALGTFRGSTGYNDLLTQGLKAVNSNVYARGLGDSGAALKALQTRGAGIADQSAQQWLGNVGQLASRGDQARGLVAGIGLNTANSNNNALQNSANVSSNALQNAADASGNARLAGAGQTNSAIQSLLNIGGTLYGSSYKPSSSFNPNLNIASQQLISQYPGIF